MECTFTTENEITSCKNVSDRCIIVSKSAKLFRKSAKYYSYVILYKQV